MIPFVSFSPSLRKKESEDWNQHDSAKRNRCELPLWIHKSSDGFPALLQKGFRAKRRGLIQPFGVPCRRPHRLNKRFPSSSAIPSPAALPGRKLRVEAMDKEPHKNQERQVGFRDMRSPQILEKQRITLQKSNDGLMR